MIKFELFIKKEKEKEEEEKEVEEEDIKRVLYSSPSALATRVLPTRLSWKTKPEGRER